MAIEAVLFDFGGVIVDLDVARSRVALQKLGGKDFNSIWTLAQQAPFFLDYETGKLSDSEFRAALRQHLQIPDASDASVDAAWRAMLVGIRAITLQTLAQLRHSRPIYLLSNTNGLHIAHVEAQLLPPHGKAQLSDIFDAVFLSHLMGVRKPDPGAFAYALDRMKCAAANVLFVDDLAENVEAARSCGLQGHHHPHNAPLRRAELPL